MQHALSPRLYCALDTVDLARARGLARQLSGIVDGVKLGLEFFTANGPDGVRAIREEGLPIFLDMKFHDIPNTVAGGARAAGALGIAVLTVHGSGGPAMLKAAAEGAREGAAKAGVAGPEVVAITVLTSIGEEDMAAVGQFGPVAEQALRLGSLALDCGLAGVVASAHEAERLRARLGPKALLVLPGIRPAAAAAGDQKRVVTPAEAVRLGGNLLVVGRPITEAADPIDAARRIAAEMRGDAPGGLSPAA
jgi:orotidine-5'-phosphate decarboxylase